MPDPVSAHYANLLAGCRVPHICQQLGICGKSAKRPPRASSRGGTRRGAPPCCPQAVFGASRRLQGSGPHDPSLSRQSSFSVRSAHLVPELTAPGLLTNDAVCPKTVLNQSRSYLRHRLHPHPGALGPRPPALMPRTVLAPASIQTTRPASAQIHAPSTSARLDETSFLAGHIGYGSTNTAAYAARRPLRLLLKPLARIHGFTASRSTGHPGARLPYTWDLVATSRSSACHPNSRTSSNSPATKAVPCFQLERATAHPMWKFGSATNAERACRRKATLIVRITRSFLAWLCLHCDILNLDGKSEKPANLAGFFAFEPTVFRLASPSRLSLSPVQFGVLLAVLLVVLLVVPLAVLLVVPLAVLLVVLARCSARCSARCPPSLIKVF